MKYAAITGNTWAVRANLYDMGGTWDYFRRAWLVPAHRADEARALVAAQGTGRKA